MMKQITVGELKKMTDKEGLILQGCGGDLKEWEDGVNELLTESGILLDGDTFKNVYAFENEGLTNLFFDMEGVKLNMGKLAIWRINTHQQFGGTWLSDYIDNNKDYEENNVIAYVNNLNIHGQGDFIKCLDCGSLLLVACGNDVCPQCHSKNLSWANSNYQECTVNDLEDLGYVIKKL